MVRFEAFEALGVAVAAMSDKSDGDCGNPTGMDGTSFCNKCGVDSGAVAKARQVHGTGVLEAESLSGAEKEADALVASTRGLALGISVADCVPLFLFDPGAGVCSLVHSGRDGTYKAIICSALEVMIERYGAQGSRIFAHIGPSAGPCCYQVSVEMAQAFERKGLPVCGRYLDLWEANRLLLMQGGVPPGNISLSATCTICQGNFHSYRGGSAKARNLALLEL